ncbi:Polymerase/histidinol phosphatase-like [Moorella glycerini]|uniref:DNA 3'-5' helicase n=1 Tax=Neomoorella stamsii TaxID=1266720 RepID=A0A9X7J2X6_9FIRM|nr:MULTISPECIES: UvrD-helicase domain-containing protein [Moorella]PRR71686.1 ATP-dependent DNA helicase PcrA [Moorella stamsii]CEP66936.1 Polymerase/histidinol phosphatase-like [Moorella glycerini]
MLPFIADFHIHSCYSRATSKDASPENFYRWALYKGVTLVGSGDFTHPAWREELRDRLEPAEDGLYRLKEEFCRAVEEDTAAGMPEAWFKGGDPLRGIFRGGSSYVPSGLDGRPLVRFIISGEISTIYKKDGRTRKVHHLILLPDLEAAEALSRRLEGIGNLHSDGRPILGLDSRQLLEMTLEACPEAIFIPAHIWTPHFSLFGANSGFDSIEECFEDLADYIYAVETGLSSDPPMNWRLSALDRLTLVSNSDAHSPRHLAREANIFNTELSYPAIRRALQEREAAGFLGTLEFFPEEGKYHYDGHRACNICWPPARTRAAGGVCPVCGRKVTVGVLHRVEILADREEGVRPEGARPYESLVPLPEVLASALGTGTASKKVAALYFDLLHRLGPELVVLREAPLEAIARVAGSPVAEAVRRMRAGEVERQPGFDGEYGRILLLRPEEREYFVGQASLFGEAEEIAAAAATSTCQASTAGKKTKPGKAVKENATVKGSDAAAQARWPADTEGLAVPAGGGVTPSIAEDPSQPAGPAGEEPVLVETAAGPGVPLAGLNEEQRLAVTATEGPVIVLAGPGTGKTLSLVHRLAYLIGMRGIAPNQITAVTFTNKAAAEIRQRVVELLGEAGGIEDLTIGTFHSICLDLLRCWPGQNRAMAFTFAGREQPTVLDESDARSILAEILQESGRGGSRQAPKLQRQISLLKSRGLLPSSPWVPEDLRPVYSAYQERLAEYGVMDYDDLLLLAVELLDGWMAAGEDTPEVKRLLARFTHLLVDEFQDVNPVQYRLIRLWSGDGGNLFVIGDPDQAIYGFRGASNRFFRQLQEDFPAARVFRLTRNYRSTPTILRAAAAVIAHNPHPGLKLPGDKVLVAAKEEGPPILHLEVPGEMAEGIAIVREIGRLVGGTTMLQAHGQGGTAPMEVPRGMAGEALGFADIAVLVRTGRQLETLEECFLKEGIPYRLVGRESFLEDRPVREALAFCWCLVNPEDDFHIYRCLGAGPFSQDKRDIALVREIARQMHCPAWQAIERLTAGEVSPGAAVRKGLQAFRNAVATWRTIMRQEPPERLLARWMEEYNLQGVENMNRLLRVAARFNDLHAFLRGVVLAGEADHERWGSNVTSPEAVSLMTLHAAKGLEFPVVFIAGVEEGLLPLKEREASTLADSDLAEERRLFYVGLTRARDILILVSSRSRTIAGRKVPFRPSPFLLEIPPECLEKKFWPGRTKGRQGTDDGKYKQLRLF